MERYCRYSVGLRGRRTLQGAYLHWRLSLQIRKENRLKDVQQMSEAVIFVQAGDNGGGLDQGGGSGGKKQTSPGDVQEMKINRAGIRGREGEFKDR